MKTPRALSTIEVAPGVFVRLSERDAARLAPHAKRAEEQHTKKAAKPVNKAKTKRATKNVEHTEEDE